MRDPISRRTVLRGAGAAVALPWLESMAGASTRIEPASAPKRLVCLFHPNGVYPPAWDPKGSGRDYELSPILSPLEHLKSEFTVVSNLGTDARGHVAATTAFLTGTPMQIRADEASLVPRMGISLDQAVAQKIGPETKLRSMELGTEPPRAGGENALPISFASTVSWAGPSQKVDPEISPAAAFDRMFGDPAAARQRALQDRSLLDRVAADSRRLMNRVSSNDKRKLDEYLTSVRDVEKRIQDGLAPKQSAWTPKTKPALVRPEDGVPARRDIHLRLMMDLMVLALQTDTTRVITLMMAHGFSRQNFTFLDGVKGDHHSISHHKEETALTVPYTIVSKWYLSQFAYLLDRMKAVDEGNGRSLLDHSIVLYGCELRDGNGHTTRNLPIVVAGRGHGALSPGQHLLLPANTALANLHLTLMQKMGIPAERFNTSTGTITQL
ncbi:MAG: DUF1552 domain-containing protein [Acidobacteria bacterium]|nr:DUF1552 domain-containing protein [Acidobacteriota bacterium]